MNDLLNKVKQALEDKRNITRAIQDGVKLKDIEDDRIKFTNPLKSKE